jgi:phthalate 4,5-dioxygenase
VHIRAYHFILPFHQIRPSKSETGAPMDAGHCWVPMDDENTMVFNWVFTKNGKALNEEDRLERSLGNGPLHVDQKTFRSIANKKNDYLIDRTVQKEETFTGIEGINAQDRAIQESMGRIVDRSKEHLGPADKAIIQARKKLRDAVRAVEAGGTPDGLGTTYYALTAEEGVLPKDADWRRELTPTLRPEAILQTV